MHSFIVPGSLPSPPPISAMAAPQAAAGARNEKAGEPGFYQNQTTVCSRPVHAVPSLPPAVLPLHADESIHPQCIASAMATPGAPFQWGTAHAFELGLHILTDTKLVLHGCLHSR